MEKRKNKSEVLKNDIIDVLVESLHIAYGQRRIRQYMCNKQSVRIGTIKESLPVSVFQLEKKIQKEKCLLRYCTDCADLYAKSAERLYE